ncbi:hypothetical protein [Halorussus marinus]|uniref:hypothetical protein n=1 Tax=Halorussus marinus TaxID=2505976 RepID=UPI00106EC20A|nr:hypothetical protein [Halorussus marinus]
MSHLAETFGEVDAEDTVRVVLDDGTEFEGRASPVDYVPDESLRVEVRPRDRAGERYEISGEYDEGWSDLTVRRADMDGDETEWARLGTVESLEARDAGGDVSADSDES